MRVFKPMPAENAELAQPVNSADFETINLLVDGSRRAGSWRALTFALIGEDEGRRLDPVDMPWLGSHALVLKQRAVGALMPMLLGHGEFLPLESHPKLWLFNATHVVDALDEQESELIRFSSGRVMSIKRHAFRRMCIDGLLAFKIPDLRVSPTFVSQEFVDRYDDAKLTGIEFALVWESN